MSSEATPAASPGTPPASAGRTRRALRVVGATVSGVLALALVGGVVAASGWLPAARPPQAAAVSIPVPATDLVLACPGGPIASDSASADAELSGSSEPVTQTAAVAFAREGELSETTLGSAEGTGAELVVGAEAAVGLVAGADSGSSQVLLRAAPVGVASAYAVAATVSRTDAGDLRSLVAAPCTAPSATSWLVGGTTTVGSSTSLVLHNPGSTPAAVTVRAWGAVGEVRLTSSQIVVPAGGEHVALLEALAPDEERLVVRLDSAGGQVSAHLQVSSLTGLVAAGTSYVTPGASPGTELTIAGVALASNEAAVAPNVLRVANPGDAEATITLTLLGEEGPLEIAGAADRVVEAGSVVDIALDGVPDGTYTASVTSDAPVVAGVELVRTGVPGPEVPDVPLVSRTWLAAQASVSDAAVALPGLGSLADGGTLALGNPSSAAMTVTVVPVTATGENGPSRAVTIGALSSAAVDLAGLGVDGAQLAAVRITAADEVSAGVLLHRTDDLGETLAHLPLLADPQVARSAVIRLALS